MLNILIVSNDSGFSALLARHLTSPQHKITFQLIDKNAATKSQTDEYTSILRFDLTVHNIDLNLATKENPLNGYQINIDELAKSYRKLKLFSIEIPPGFITQNEAALDSQIQAIHETLAARRATGLTVNTDTLERIEITLPSALEFMDEVLAFLVNRAEQVGIASSENTNLYTALNEAFVNAVKHGNKLDPAKTIHIIVEFNSRQARFTFEDQGEGFDRSTLPNPLESENLLKTSGRGIHLIRHIMDEVEYNASGNGLVMVMRAKSSDGKTS
ncbi:MAG: ATP-binding protein [Pyrinomonadaceae bacterium]